MHRNVRRNATTRGKKKERHIWQRVQNNAARIVLEAPRRSHASPLLRTLHWLPVQQRIEYKVALLAFKIHSTSTLSYLRLLIQDREHGCNLRSTTTVLCQPFTTTTFAKCAFQCSAPAVWNSLPKTVLSSDSVTVYTSRLKTFLFSQAFSSFSAHCPAPVPLKLRPYGAIQICLLLYYYYYYYYVPGQPG